MSILSSARLPETRINNNAETILRPLQALRDSYGLPPFRFKTLETTLLQHRLPGEIEPENGAWLLAFAIRPEITKDHIDGFIRDISSRKGTAQPALYRHGKYLETIINRRNKEGRSWAEKQVDIALNILHTAAHQTYTSARILQDIDLALLDQLTGFADEGWHTTTLVLLKPATQIR